MTAKEFYSALLSSLKKRKDLAVRKYKLRYLKGEYDFLRIASNEIGSDDKVILIRAGIHGDEIAGPLTILSFCNEIIDYIHRARLKCIIYPLGNPSGFEAGIRYNIDRDEGKAGNNDFLRYELEDGKIVDVIKNNDEFKKWHWASDQRLKIKLPAETRLMHRLLKRDPLTQIIACIDLHQDFILPKAKPSAYCYSFSDPSVYKDIIGKIEKTLSLLSSEPVSAGFKSKNVNQSDSYGFIVFHEGSLDDLMHRIGVKYCVTVETTGTTPVVVACQVNLIWIFGIVDLIKEGS